MSEIRCVYTAEPKFPATDQHPDAKRYKIGDYWVDAIGGDPTPEAIDAMLNPPKQLTMLERLQARIGAAEARLDSIGAAPAPIVSEPL